MQAALEWTTNAFDNVGLSPLALPLAFLLGLASAVASACCTLPILGAAVGYAGTRKQLDRRSNMFTAFAFMLGSTLAILILGCVAGFIGQVAQSTLGRYWKIFAGIMAITFGLAALNLLPFKLPHAKTNMPAAGNLGAALFGLIMGGAVSIFSLACNPGIYIILGVAILQGYTLWMMGVLISFAIGFSLPLATLVLGVSFGKATVKAKRTETAIRIIAGIVLISVGFYFLNSF